jgi:beta-lactamase class A
MIAYVAKELHGGRRLAANEAVQLPAFSTIKILLAAAFWRAVEAGELSERQAFAFQPWASVGGSGVLRGFRHAAEICFGDLAHLMLAVSDNDATNIVASFVGFDRVNALAEELGLGTTRMRRLMMDTDAAAAGRDNVTSAADLAALLEELVTGERLGPAVTGPIWASLDKQEHRDGIARYLPRDAAYAGKCGDDAPDGRFVHDCCLIRHGERRVVMSIMTDGAGGYETVSRLGAALLDAVQQDLAVQRHAGRSH